MRKLALVEKYMLQYSQRIINGIIENINRLVPSFESDPSISLMPFIYLHQMKRVNITEETDPTQASILLHKKVLDLKKCCDSIDDIDESIGPFIKNHCSTYSHQCKSTLNRLELLLCKDTTTDLADTLLQITEFLKHYLNDDSNLISDIELMNTDSITDAIIEIKYELLDVYKKILPHLALYRINTIKDKLQKYDSSDTKNFERKFGINQQSQQGSSGSYDGEYIKKLYKSKIRLRAHPDKNIGKESLAKDITLEINKIDLKFIEKIESSTPNDLQLYLNDIIKSISTILEQMKNQNNTLMVSTRGLLISSIKKTAILLTEKPKLLENLFDEQKDTLCQSMFNLHLYNLEGEDPENPEKLITSSFYDIANYVAGSPLSSIISQEKIDEFLNKNLDTSVQDCLSSKTLREFFPKSTNLQTVLFLNKMNHLSFKGILTCLKHYGINENNPDNMFSKISREDNSRIVDRDINSYKVEYSTIYWLNLKQYKFMLPDLTFLNIEAPILAHYLNAPFEVAPSLLRKDFGAYFRGVSPTGDFEKQFADVIKFAQFTESKVSILSYLLLIGAFETLSFKNIAQDISAQTVLGNIAIKNILSYQYTESTNPFLEYKIDDKNSSTLYTIENTLDELKNRIKNFAATTKEKITIPIHERHKTNFSKSSNMLSLIVSYIMAYLWPAYYIPYSRKDYRKLWSEYTQPFKESKPSITMIFLLISVLYTACVSSILRIAYVSISAIIMAYQFIRGSNKTGLKSQLAEKAYDQITLGDLIDKLLDLGVFSTLPILLTGIALVSYSPPIFSAPLYLFSLSTLSAILIAPKVFNKFMSTTNDIFELKSFFSFEYKDGDILNLNPFSVLYILVTTVCYSFIQYGQNFLYMTPYFLIANLTIKAMQYPFSKSFDILGQLIFNAIIELILLNSIPITATLLCLEFLSVITVNFASFFIISNTFIYSMKAILNEKGSLLKAISKTFNTLSFGKLGTAHKKTTPLTSSILNHNADEIKKDLSKLKRKQQSYDIDMVNDNG